MSEFYLEKYPVVSAEGNEYLVSITTNKFGGKVVDAHVLQREVKRGWFGKTRAIWRRVSGDLFFADSYDEVSFEYDYVLIAKRVVQKVEERLLAQNQHEASRKAGAEQFEAWDGKESAE